MAPAEVCTEVTDSGLRGRGGAAFPTGIKMKTVLDTAGDQKYVVCNADESEPGTFKDRVLLEADPFAVVEAIAIASLATGVEHAYVYIRGEYLEPYEILVEALEELKERPDLRGDVTIVASRNSG